MTSDALLALRPCEVVPEDAVRHWLHAVQQDLDRLDSAVRQAEADADEAERRLEPNDMGPDGAEHFEAELRQSLDQLVSTTERELHEELDDAYRQARTRVSNARTEAETVRARSRAIVDHPTRAAAPHLSVVEDTPPIEARDPYIELREITSRVLEPVADPHPTAAQLAEPWYIPLDAAPVVEDDHEFPHGPDVSGETTDAMHEAFWNEVAAVHRVNHREVLSAAFLPMLAAVLVLAALLLLLG